MYTSQPSAAGAKHGVSRHDFGHLGMTASLIAAAAALAGWILIFAPKSGAFGKIALLIIAVGCLLFHIAGRALMAPHRLQVAINEVVKAWWPLLLLSGFILGGSAYARLIDDIKETFLGFGIGMLFLPLVAVAIRSSARPFALMKGLAGVYVVTVLVMLALLPLGRGPFHEEIFIAVPLGTYFLSARPLRAWQAALGLALVGVCLLSVKNTTFLLVLLTLGACALIWTSRLSTDADKLRAAVKLYFGILTVLGTVVALLVSWTMFRSELPSGSPEYRLEMYGIAWRRFLSSPLWGAGFTDTSVTYFDLFRTETETRILPTHSDVLDMLAHGGLIAIGLWLASVWKLFVIWWDALRTVAFGPRRGAVDSAKAMRRWRWLFVMSMVQICAIVTYVFNPVLLQPVHNIWVWGGMGLTWALHRLLINGEDDAAAASASRRSAFA